MAEETREKTNFIWEAIKADIAEGKNGGRVQTRFPPEPNGYLHIGHVKALSVDFLTAERFGGVCNLRFDDTNPTKEKEEFVEAIKDDIHWLGFNYANVYYASEQYDQIYEFALDLIRRFSSLALRFWSFVCFGIALSQIIFNILHKYSIKFRCFNFLHRSRMSFLDDHLILFRTDIY